MQRDQFFEALARLVHRPSLDAPADIDRKPRVVAERGMRAVGPVQAARLLTDASPRGGRLSGGVGSTPKAPFLRSPPAPVVGPPLGLVICTHWGITILPS